MSVNLSPIGNDAPFLDASGNPLTGGLLYTYVGGSTSTAQTTYTTSAGNVSNANPIVLDSNGYPSAASSVVEIWLTAGATYKFVLKTYAGVTVWSRDNISGINDTSVSVDQWQAGPTPTYISATSFSLVGDQTSTFQVGRRIKTTNTAGTIYSVISASSYGVLTTVTVVNDSGTLDSGLSAVSYAVLTSLNPSVPILKDINFLISGSADQTKKFRFEADGITTGTTRVITVPDSDITLGAVYGAAGFAANVGGAISVSSSTAIFAIKDASGANPSSSSTVDLYFQSATVTTGTVTKRQVSAADSITIPSTALVGTVNSKASRIYFGYLDNAGTPELCYWNPIIRDANGFITGVFCVDTGAIYTTVANTAASDNAGVIYSTSARTGVRVIPIAYADSVQNTAGTWAQAFDKLTIIGPATPVTGKILQTKQTFLTDASFSTASATFTDITGLTVSVTPSSKSNLVECEASIMVGASAASRIGFLMVGNAVNFLQGDTAGSRLRGTTGSTPAGAANFQTVSMRGIDAPGIVTAGAYKIQVYTDGSTMYMNRDGTYTDGASFMTGTSSIMVREICA